MRKLQTTEGRSRLMSRIRSTRNETTELRFASLLRSERITGWRRHEPILGKPDFAFPEGRVLVFVDGCFWHFCPRCGHLPRSNSAFWAEKLTRNRQRDHKITDALRKQGWQVLRLWEHELARPARVVAKLRYALKIAKKPR